MMIVEGKENEVVFCNKQIVEKLMEFDLPPTRLDLLMSLNNIAPNIIFASLDNLIEKGVIEEDNGLLVLVNSGKSVIDTILDTYQPI